MAAIGCGTEARGLATAGPVGGRHGTCVSSGACRTSGESGPLHADSEECFGETAGCALARSSGTRVPVPASSGCLQVRFPTDVCELVFMVVGKSSDDLVKETV